MKTSREDKNKLRNTIYEIRDYIVNGIDDKSLDEEATRELNDELIKAFREFGSVCKELKAQWSVYGEIDRLARLNAEYDRMKAEVEEALTMLGEYLEYLRTKPLKSEKSPFVSEMEKINELDTLIAKMESSLTQAKQQQELIYTKLGINKFSYSDPTVVAGKGSPMREMFTEIAGTGIPTSDQRRQPKFSTPFSSSEEPPAPPSMFSSSPQTWKPSGWFSQDYQDDHNAVKHDPDQLTKETQVKTDPFSFGSQQRRTSKKEKSSTDYESDPFKGLTKLPVPKFKGDKRSFESWYAGFYQTVGKHQQVPPEQKLLRLYSCLEGEALRTVQNLGYSPAAYGVAINRLTRKYGGQRREISLRLEDLDRFRRVREGNATDLEQFAELLDTLIVKLTDSGQASELKAGSLYITLLRKLNEPLIVKYQDWLRENHMEGTVRNLYTFVNEEAESWMTAVETVKGLGPEKAKPHQNTGRTMVVPQVQVEGKRPAIKCQLCSKEHGLWKCDQFKELPIDERWDKARELRVCFRCLSSFHRSNSCRSKRLCQINGCRSNHHRLLHNVRNRSENTDQKESKPQEEQLSGRVEKLCPTMNPTEGERSQPKTYVTPGLSSAKNSTSPCEYLTLRTVPVLLRNGERSLRINALLDDASTRSYLNEDVADYLNLQGEEVSLSVHVLNNTRTSIKSSIVSCELESCDGQIKEQVTVHTTNRVTGNLHAIDWSQEKHKWSHLKDINFPVKGKRPIVDMLIGLDHSDLHCAIKEIRGHPGEPIARLTPLGWTCIQPPQLSVNGDMVNVTYCTQLEDMELNVLVKQMWEVEQLPSSSLMSNDDKEAELKVRASLSEVPNGYMVGLPWRSNANTLGNNYSNALSRLESTERKLRKQPEVAEAYQTVFDKYKDKGYIKEVDEKYDQAEKIWYLPHFPVVRMDKVTTKVRPVFDASARFKGVSLNDVILQGPKLQSDLTHVLTRFRRSPVALVCDITEMYLQVHMKPSDQSVHRFLWREMDNSKKPTVYQFTRVVFGVNASPYLAQFVNQHNASVNKHEFPRAAETVCESTYMDDSMDSVDTADEAIKLYQELKSLYGKAGMTPKKWLSNKAEVLEAIPKEDRVSSLDLESDAMPVIKTLGVSWSSEPDQFTFVVNPPIDLQLTKRRFLSRTATLFDPLGFLSPYTVRARMILQEMWIAGLTWDEDLPEDLNCKASAWFEELSQLSDIKVPRALRKEGTVIDSKLHVFSDASEAAYGAVAYLVNRYQSGSVTVRLVTSRAKVAPLKATSIPRLELMGAIVGLLIAEATCLTCKIDLNKVVFWTDSLDVLFWVRGQSRQFKPFVANRVGEIQTKTNPSQWRYVPTKSNPADKLSRGSSAESLVDDEFWWEGPEYLKEAEEGWPVLNLPIPKSPSATVETKKRYQVCEEEQEECAYLTVQKEDDRLHPKRYSSWLRMVRVAAYVIRFVMNCRRTAKLRSTGPLTSEELNVAQVHYIKQAQLECFYEEVKSLRAEKLLHSTSKLLPLNPFMDDDGLIRCNGRLRFAKCLPWKSRLPIILPRKHVVTSLIIHDAHNQCQHGGTNQVLAQLAVKYWIISAREAIRECERECTKCSRRKAKPAVQIMAPLSGFRTDKSLRAFNQTSVDFAGPFLTKQGRGKTRQKRYLCLFTCLSCRAVHLEMAYGLDTDSFLNAFYRMVSRRGLPEVMVSDNGTNFVSGDRELKELVAGLDKDKIQTSAANKGIKWHFNPPGAPHFNGVHEVMVKAAKRAIKAILGNADINDEELHSAIVGAEGLINSRPLTYQSANALDDIPLTPNHFLHGQVGGQFAPDTVDSTDFNPRKRWRRVQELVRHFWNRWLREWLPALSPRGKWAKTQDDMKVGDLVLVLQPDTPRGKWPLGRIIKTYAGADGHVRTADIKLKDTVLKRPVVKLCPIERKL